MDQLDTVTEHVAGILDRYKPEEIFVPHCKEPSFWSQDHDATNRIIRSAVKRTGADVNLFEYPVWLWCVWPWATLPVRSRRRLPGIIKNNITCCWHLMRDLRCALYIGDILSEKRTALDCHASQMTQLKPEPGWKTLADVANGDWLACFFQDYELYSPVSQSQLQDTGL
jgi:LmbE family N-acetylglucosaminyl deacetylase